MIIGLFLGAFRNIMYAALGGAKDGEGGIRLAGPTFGGPGWLKPVANCWQRMLAGAQSEGD